MAVEDREEATYDTMTSVDINKTVKKRRNERREIKEKKKTKIKQDLPAR